MFRLFFFVMFAPLFIFSCSAFDEEPVSVVSVSPPEGSTIEPLESIVVEFTNVPENLHVYTRQNANFRYDSHGAFSLSGRIATIRSPFEYSVDRNFTKIIEGLELHLFWGREEEYTHLLNFSVAPRWADGILTITVGNYQNSWEMHRRMQDRDIVMDSAIDTYIGNFPMSRTEKSVDVAVVKLLDVGFSQPVTIEEIRQRFSELGYRPLTLEEAVELRLQFNDQPSEDVLMNGFTVLLSEESMQLLPGCVLREGDFGKWIAPCDEDEEIEEILGGTLHIVNVPGFIDLGWQRAGLALRTRWFFEDTLLAPYDLSNSDNVFTRALSKFACVMEK